MPHSENFHLQQIYHFLKSLQKLSPDLAVCTMFENKCMQEVSLRVGISMLYKLNGRLYLVPECLSKMFLGLSASCFRGCGQTGTPLHTWWTGPKLRRFWLREYAFILSVTLVNIIKDASIVLLNKPVENVPRHTQTLIYFMFLAAKIVIATAWKSPVIALMKRKLT